MSIVDVKNLTFIRQIPVIGARLYEAFNSIQQGVTAMAVQGNLNPTGEIDPPPAIQSVNAAGANGTLTVSIEHTAADVNRGVRYYVEHADNPAFVNPQIRHIGDSRSFSEFVGNQTRYVRAYAAYPGSAAGPILYHGGASSPQPVEGGGQVGPPDYFPSQGSGTGAPGQGGHGPGIVSTRSDSGGFDWRKQKATGSSGGTGSPGSANGIGSDSGSGGGGGGIISGGLLVDTHARRLTTYPSVKYPVNTEYYETDRTTFYWVQNAAGTVTVTTGTTVTWVSGNHFINTGTGFTAAQWPAGTPILINGVTCRVSVVNSSTVLTLQSATTNAAGVSYSVASGRWVYFGGEYEATSPNLPTDLGENDYSGTIGFLFTDTTHWRIFQWSATGAAPASTSPGWTRAAGELPTGTISILPFGPGQFATGWSSCNGTAGVSITQDDASTTNITTPNFSGSGSFPKGGTSGAYTGATVAATDPTIGGSTDSTAIGFIPAAGAAPASVSATHGAKTGADFDAVTAIDGGGGGGGGSLVTDPHSHTLASATVVLPGDPVSAIVVPFYMKR